MDNEEPRIIAQIIESIAALIYRCIFHTIILINSFMY